MSSANVEVFKGRVAVTTKSNFSLNLLNAGVYSVVTSDGFYDKHQGPDGSASKAKLVDVLFFVAKGDAWEESAYVLGKRTHDAHADEEAARRRSRSIGGSIVKGISMTVCGKMGIGRVAGEYNTAGSRQDDVRRRSLSVHSSDSEPGVGAKLAVAAVEALQGTQVGLATDKYPHAYAGPGGTVVSMRAAKIVAEKDDKVQVQLKNADGSAGGKTWIAKQLALDVFGRPVDPLGQSLEFAEWPTIAELVIAAFCPASRGSHGMLVQYFPLRGTMLLLAACAVISASDVENLPLELTSSAQSCQAERLSKWMAELEDRVHAFSDRLRGARGPQPLLSAARAVVDFGEAFSEAHIARALLASEAEAARASDPDTGRGGRMIGVSPPNGNVLSAVRRPEAGRTTLGDVPPMAHLGGISVTPVSDGRRVRWHDEEDDGGGVNPSSSLRQLAAASPPSMGGVLPTFQFAACFLHAASSLPEFDKFVRVASLHTMHAAMRESTFIGDFDDAARRTAAAALDGYFIENITMELSALRALLPQSVSGAGMDHSLLCNIFRSIAENSSLNKTKLGSSSGSSQPQQIRVHVGGENFLAGTDEDSRPEFASLARDASEVAESHEFQEQLGALEGAAMRQDFSELQTKMSSAGAPLRRMLLTPAVSELSKVITHSQWKDDMMQKLLSVRAALERRTCIGVFGSAATEPSTDELKCFSYLRQGKLGKARPSLLVTGSAASTQADPLSFLSKLPSEQQEAALCGAFLMMIAALQISFPGQAAQSMRFYLKVQRWIFEQRGAGATWPTLSAWYAGLCKRADQRVEKLLLRSVDTLAPLDIAWVTDSGASYNQHYLVARAPELATAAAQQQQALGEGGGRRKPRTGGDGEEGGRGGKKKKQKTASGGASGGGGGGGSGSGSGGGRGGGRGGTGGGGGGSGGGSQSGGGGGGSGASGSGGSGKGGGSSAGAGGSGGQQQAQLLLTNNNNNSSGKRVPDKAKHWQPGTSWDLTTVMESLCQELGEWNGKKPCAFHFISSKGCNRGSDCRWYH